MGAAAVNNNPYAHVSAEVTGACSSAAESVQAVALGVPARRNWPPMNLPFDLTTSHKHWLTRGARGITWHRAGLVSQEPLR
jgi:hypothetical protein